MELRPEYQLKTALKALTDTVLPAVDPNNKLAQEQAGLVVGMLKILQQRLPLLYRYDLDELSRSLQMADELQALGESRREARQALQELTPSVAKGRDVRQRARAEPAELEAINFELREKIGALVTAMSTGASATDLRSVGSIVMEHAQQQLLRERSWLSAQGWEPASGLPAIETLLGDAPGTAS